MAVPKPNIRWRGAHPNNFTVGRPGGGLNGDETFHHVVGSRESAVIVFNQATRGASAHFVVGADIIDQCVDIANTAWADGNWDHNIRAITVEHEGGQNGNGPYSDGMYENAAHLVAWLRQNYGIVRYVRHRDVSQKSTACPGGLDVERIWARSQQIINSYNQPPAQPDWLKNRKAVALKKMYNQNDGFFLRNLNDPSQPVDSRRFARNTSFDVAGYTEVGGKRYWITKSSMDLNAPNGMLDGEIKDTPYTPPVVQPPLPEVPQVPDWASKLLVDDVNRPMYVIRATPLIDLENGHPVVKDGKEVWFEAGAKIEDVSAHTIVGGKTYQMTEYSFGKTKAGDWKGFGNGILSDDLSVDPAATPPGTPHNPDTEARLTALEKLVKLITDFLDKIFKDWRK